MSELTKRERKVLGGVVKPWSEPTMAGRLDVDGNEWWACDPYPTWYRWEGNKLITGEPKWAK